MRESDNIIDGIFIGEDGEIRISNGDNEILIGSDGSVQIINGDTSLSTNNDVYNTTYTTEEQQVPLNQEQNNVEQLLWIITMGIFVLVLFGSMIFYIKWNNIKSYICRKLGINKKE